MLQEPPVTPHNLSQWFIPILATFLGVVSGWFARRRREPIELRKLEAETRSIEINTDAVAGELVLKAIEKAQRLMDERVHWQSKAEALQCEVEKLNIEVESMDNQMRRMAGFISASGLHLSDLDKPREH